MKEGEPIWKRTSSFFSLDLTGLLKERQMSSLLGRGTTVLPEVLLAGHEELACLAIRSVRNRRPAVAKSSLVRQKGGLILHVARAQHLHKQHSSTRITCARGDL